MVIETRAPLNRQRILRAALEYVDKHGLAALSMHKLAAEFGVKGMSLYNHVEGKEGLLDGVVETMWAEVQLPERAPTWQQDMRTFAQTLRGIVRRHPKAAQLLIGRPIMPTQALEFFDAYVGRLRDRGLSEPRALELVRTIISYAVGFALFEITWTESAKAPTEPDDGLRAFQHVSNMVPADTPEHLLRFGIMLCTRCDMNTQFSSGIDLMLRGIETENTAQAARD